MNTSLSWYDDREIEWSFASVLVDQMLLQDVEAVLYFFEKPWKWTPEYELWNQHGAPQEGDAEYYVFVAALDELVLS